MNCGMEDCIVLNDCFESEGSISAALDKYTKVRNPDAEAMCDLALYNYIEVMFVFIQVLVLDTLLTFCRIAMSVIYVDYLAVIKSGRG